MNSTLITVASCNPHQNNQVAPTKVGLESDLGATARRPALSCNSSLLQLDVSGASVSVPRALLQRFPDSALARISQQQLVPQQLSDTVFLRPDGCVYVDCNQALFAAILDVYRYGELHPPALCAHLLTQELRRWGLPEDRVAECCSGTHNTSLSDNEAIKNVVSYMALLKGAPLSKDASSSEKRKRKIWLFLDFPHSSRGAMAYAIVTLILTMLMVVVQTIWTFDSVLLRTQDVTVGNTTTEEISYNNLVFVLMLYDVAYTSFLFFEFFIRLSVCPSKKAFFSLFTTWVDIVAVPPSLGIYLYWLCYLYWQPLQPQSDFISALIILTTLRVVRLLYIARIFPSVKIMMLALTASAKELALLVLFIFIFVVIFGQIMFQAEDFSNSMFKSGLHSMWWALITMTTIGYGDYYPTTPQGYVVATVTALSGMVIIVMPIPIIANNFYLFYGYFDSRSHLIT